MTPTAFYLCLVCVALIAAAAFLLGAYLSYHRGYFDAVFDLTVDKPTDDLASIRWQCTAAAETENSTPPQLT